MHTGLAVDCLVNLVFLCLFALRLFVVLFPSFLVVVSFISPCQCILPRGNTLPQNAALCFEWYVQLCSLV